jgi:tetratricopeptide (TPR) repeat protein
VTDDDHSMNSRVAPSRTRVRVFRLFSIFVVPISLLLAGEVALRLFGFGHDTRFTRSCSVAAVESRCENPSFSWQFFPREIARTPVAFAFPVRKEPGTLRIFVVGGSAAQGDPEPSFGFGRVLETMLRQRHPDVTFEVVNAGVTAINSHVVVPIVRDLARYDPDLFLVYLGNNEVVGPYGAGTVFSPLVESRSLIRASLFVRGTRIGQLVSRVLGTAEKAGTPTEWRGMEMFAEHRIAADDDRLETMYAHFEANLREIVRTARDSDAAVVLGTVGVNLRDSAPFASIHRGGISAADRSAWEREYEAGIRAQQAGDLPAAADAYRRAASIDDRFADLQYRLGTVLLSLGEISEAEQRFLAARDLDALRFRADGRIDGIVREVGEDGAGEEVVLVDLRAALVAADPFGIPGADLFDDHVHLGPAGNYVVARTLLAGVERVLSRRGLRAGRDLPEPSFEETADRMAYTGFDRRRLVTEMARRMARPPFTAQSDHASRTRAMREELESLASFAGPDGMAEADAVYVRAIAAAPDDPWLRYNHGVLLTELGRFDRAAEAFHSFLGAIPHDVPAREKLSVALASSGRFEEAVEVCENLAEEYPDFTPPYYTRAYSLTQLGRFDDALSVYRNVLPRDPEMEPRIWGEIGKILAHLGRDAEAREAFALAERSGRGDGSRP